MSDMASWSNLFSLSQWRSLREGDGDIRGLVDSLILGAVVFVFSLLPVSAGLFLDPWSSVFFFFLSLPLLLMLLLWLQWRSHRHLLIPLLAMRIDDPPLPDNPPERHLYWYAPDASGAGEYGIGLSVPDEHEKPEPLFPDDVKKAALRGETEAELIVGECYRLAAWHHLGAERYILYWTAKIWYRRAAKGGHPGAKEMLAKYPRTFDDRAKGYKDQGPVPTIWESIGPGRWPPPPAPLPPAVPKYVSRVLQPGEEVKYSAKIHSVAYWKEAVFAFIGIIFFIVIPALGIPAAKSELIPRSVVAVSWGGAFIFLVMSFLYLLYRYIQLRMVTEIVVTSRRFIYKRGLIQRRTFEIPLSRVTLVDVRPMGLWSRVFGFSGVTVFGVSGPPCDIEHVKNPHALRNHITVPVSQDQVGA